MKTIFNLSAAIAFLLTCSTHAAVYIEIIESGTDLIMKTDGGALDLTGLAKEPSTSGYNAGFSPNVDGFWAGGLAGSPSTVELWESGSFSYSGDSLSGLLNVEPDSVNIAGDLVGASDGQVAVPDGFSSGDTITGSSVTFNNTSFSSIGWVLGNTGTWDWGSDSITLSAVPEPSNFALFAGVIALVWLVRRRVRG